MMPLERPTHSATPSTADTPELATPEPEGRPYTEPLSEGEDDEFAVAPAQDEDRRTGLSGAAVAEAIAARQKMLAEEQAEAAQQPRAADSAAKGGESAVEEEEEGEGDEGYGADDERAPLLRAQAQARRASAAQQRPQMSEARSRALSIDPLAPSQAFDESFRRRLKRAASDAEVRDTRSGQARDEEGAESALEQAAGAGGWGDERLLVNDFFAAPGKRIAVPVRVEPKVYFACERTFLVSHPERRLLCSARTHSINL